MPLRRLYRIISRRYQSLTEEEFLYIITLMHILGKVDIENGVVRAK